MNILGIESSCDETSVAVISNDKLKANLISSQDFHAKYGGVVPELSSRAHLQIIIPLIKDALKKSHLELKDIDLICSTAGPGLIGALLVGLTFAKGFSYSLKKPFIPVDHIEGHIYSGFLMNDKPEFPCLTLVVSGGHTILVLVKSFTEMKVLGTTIDDAAGEAFDKVSKMLGFSYPGGPQIQMHAEFGNENKIDFPVAETKGYDFSFSGLKTAVLRYIQKNYPDKEKMTEQSAFGGLYDIAASFQKAVVKALTQKTKNAIENYNINSLSLVGGVAANKKLREAFTGLSNKYQKKLVIPDLQYCGDNAAMIALRGKTLFDSGKRFGLNYPPYPSFRFENYR